MTSAQTPPENELKDVLTALRNDNPTLGVPKLHALLLATRPDWAVSEKRARKILQNEGLVLNSNTSTKQNSAKGDSFPKSKLIEALDVSRITDKVDVHYFDTKKGKGLLAKQKLTDGEVVWKEDPFVLAPEWEIFDLQMSSLSCAHCSTPLSGSSLMTNCPGLSSSPSCPAKFCSRLCLSRSAKTHPLLCRSRNPASAPLINFARKNEWMALYALTQCTARLLLDYQQDETLFKTELDVTRSFAQLGMEQRAKQGSLPGIEPDRAVWEKAHQLFVQALRDPVTEPERKKLSKILKKPIPKNLLDDIFEYESFLWGLGRMSLNLEAHGGLYILHSHLNHSCSPNISVRHLDQRTALSRITLIAKKDIQPGEELFITYVNPNLSVAERRKQLLEWGFGECNCERCTTEERDPSLNRASNGGLDDLERELKAGLGVV
ncbi:hypothetical protein QCA50_008309 [Cerrena zonata]|uniref:Histone-lysine N-methyltransferase SET5 n=1 Tax=Cerrena zonata TaxID=2478898 RepID=A0AAW0G5M8_9APHY